MKFLADMGISPRVVRTLRDNGHDAIHLQEQGLGRMSDADVLIKARNEERVLLTHDLDFGELLATSGENLPSVIIFRLSDMRSENITRYLNGILAQQSQTLAKGAVCSVTEHKIRIRPLPI